MVASHPHILRFADTTTLWGNAGFCVKGLWRSSKACAWYFGCTFGLQKSAYLLLGRAMLGLGRIPEAIDSYAISRSPNFSHAKMTPRLKLEYIASTRVWSGVNKTLEWGGPSWTESKTPANCHYIILRYHHHHHIQIYRGAKTLWLVCWRNRFKRNR